MNRKRIKFIAASLAALSCMYTVPQRVMASTTFSLSTIEDSASSAFHKDKKDDCKDEKKEEKKDKKDDCKEGKKSKKDDDKDEKLDLFTEDNCKYLSSEQKDKLKKCQDTAKKGEKLTDDQKKAIHEMVDCIVKGRLGDEKYKDFNCLMEKKRKGEKLSAEEEKKLKDYMNIIQGKEKATAAEIISQFLR